MEIVIKWHHEESVKESHETEKDINMGNRELRTK